MRAKTPLITLLLFIFFFSLQSVNAQIAQCKDITVTLDTNGQASIVWQDIDNNSSGGGGNSPVFSIDINTFDCSNLGENTVTLTVSNSGISDSCTATVTVISGNYADLQCSDYIVGNDPGQEFAIIRPADFDGSNITINDNGCPSDTFTGSYSPSGFGFIYLIGQPRQVTYTYTNNYGEEQSCTFNVIVNDTEAPVLGGCPTTDVVLLEGETLQEPSITGSSDNHDTNSELVIERVDAGPAFGTVPTSDFTVQYRIVDTSGNESSICSYNVVIDNAPIIICQSPSVIVDENTSAYEFTLNELASTTNDLSATANLAFGTGTEVPVVIDDNSPTDQILNAPTGFHYQLFELIPPTTGSYTFNLSGNNSSNLFIWEGSFNPNTGDFALRPGYVGFASFNANGSLAQGSNNNTFTLQQDKTYYMSALEDGENVFFTGTLAFSSELIYVNGPSSITLDLDCSDAGTIIPTNSVYAYEDNGQNTSCVPSINATENVAPIFIDCPTDITVNIDPNSAGAIVNFTLNATDNCTATQDLQISQTSGLGSGEFFPTGETIQTFTVTDASGNTDECTFTITVEDSEAPTISCQDVTLPQLPTIDIGYTILPSDFDNGSTDNSSQLDFLAEYDQFYINIDNTNSIHSNLYHQSSIFTVPSNGAYTFNFDLTKNDEGSGTFVPQFRYSIWNIPPTENGDGLIADTTIDIATGQAVSGNRTTTLSAGVKYYMHIYAASSTSTTFENLTGTMSVDTSISSSLPMFIDCSPVNLDDVTITAIDGVGNTDTCTASVPVSNISCPIELIISPTANQDFQLPFMPYTGETYAVNWGDGTSTTGHTGYTNHTYALAEEYTIKIYGNISYFRFSDVDLNNANAPILKSVVSWGDNVWETMLEAFNGCSNLESLPVTPPDLSNVTSMNRMFARASIFNQDISNWDVSNVTHMEGVFSATIFNRPLNGWNVSNVTTMEGMFLSATEFNQPLNNWNVSNVINMTGMFLDAYLFNGDITTWNTSNLVSANGMFANASSFNQNLGTWDISSLNNAFVMFSNTSLSTTNYDNLLIGWANLDAGEAQIPIGTAFDAPQTHYCNGEAAKDELMFTYGWAISDDGPDPLCGLEPFITKWNVEASESITIPTTGTGYNYYIDWGDGTIEENLTGNASHAYATEGEYEVKIYDVFPRIDFSNSTNENKAKIREIVQWGDIQWTSMENAFSGCSKLIVTASDTPDLSNVTNTERMFFDCQLLVGNDSFNNWDVSNVTNMSHMFNGAFKFNSDISGWNVSNVTDMIRMFANCRDFNQHLNNWDVSNVTDMSQMFFYTTFGQNIDDWDISSLVSANNMFSFNNSFSTENYDALLIGWANLDAGETQIPTGVDFGAPSIRYCRAKAARTALIDTYGWTINDADQDPACTFNTKWNVGAGESITIPTTGSGYNYSIDWGDGTIEENLTGDASHTYAAANEYEVKISGDFPRIDFNSSTSVNRAKIKEVTNWGINEWTTMENAFFSCSNLNITASDVPNLSNVSNLKNMFFNCTNFNSDINNWDVSNVTNMFGMFIFCSSFNQPLNNWDVSNVTDMSFMFNSATSFNQDIGDWDITSLDFINGIFTGVTLSIENYDALLIGWATQEAEEGPIPTGLNFDGGGSRYCDGEAARTELMSTYSWGINDDGRDFRCNFSPFITKWNVEAGESITIPTTETGYNYYIDWGDGSTIEENLTGDASHAYAIAGEYEVKIYGDFPRIYFRDLSIIIKRRIREVVQWGDIEWTSMENAFSGCTRLNVTATDTPDLSQVTNAYGMFNSCHVLIGNSSFNNWDVSNITNMQGMFAGVEPFNQDIGNWNVSNVTNMSFMFFEAYNFNQDIGNWDVSNVTNMNSMFYSVFNASVILPFDQDLSNWDITSLQNTTRMFRNLAFSTENYDALLIGWSTQEAGEGPIPTGISFYPGRSYYCNGESARTELMSTYSWGINDSGLSPLCGLTESPFITRWENVLAFETLTIPTMGDGYNYIVDWGDGTIDAGITGDASHDYITEDIYADVQERIVKIYGDFPRIDFSNATDEIKAKIKEVVQWGDIEWTSMETAFSGCSNLIVTASDTPDLSNVTNAEGMFSGCQLLVGNDSFNNWDVSNITNMEKMFENASNFDQNLGDWDITSLVSGTEMFSGVTLSTENYDALLIGWSTQEAGEGPIPSDINLVFDAGNSKYCEGVHARNLLVASVSNGGYGWTINDLGIEDPTCGLGNPFITKWNVGANESITIPTTGSGYNYVVDWGDGIIESNLTGNASHTYATTDTYEVKIYGDFPRINFFPSDQSNRNKLETIEQWGDIEWTSMFAAFHGCENLKITNPDIDEPDLSNVTNTESMFVDCINFDSDISNWDVSNVIYMDHMFNGCISFNQPLNNWDVSNVIGMSSMFSGATSFDQNLGNWDITNLQFGAGMFTNVTLSIENYDALLIGWSTQEAGEGPIPTDLELDAGSSQYCLGEDAKTLLVASVSNGGYNWDISDGDKNSNCLNIGFSPIVYLQGASLNPNAGEEHLMRDDLRVAGIIPTRSPYADMISCEATVFDVTGDDAIVDWVWVELRDATDNTAVLDGQSALLQRDGDIVSVDGVTAVEFAVASGNYYIAIKHRNHLGIMSANTIALSATATIIDFTDGSTPTFGINAQTTFGMPSGTVAMWTGNVNDDALIQYSGTSPDTPTILSTVLNDPGNFLNFPTYAVSGYKKDDINLNGNTQYSGTAPDTPIILQNVLAHPGNFLNFSTYQIIEQLPNINL